jgi:hypothetical protein
MSTLKTGNITHPSSTGTAITLDASDNVNFNSNAVTGIASINGGQIGGSRNLLINSAMQVAQRSSSVTGITSSSYPTVDRWKFEIGNMGTWTASQEASGPSGFSSSAKILCTTADASPAATDEVKYSQFIEAQNLQQLAYGTSDAKQMTLSFWVKSNKTGTYIVWFYQDDDGRQLTTSYTIDVADTWEYKTILVASDTTGVIDNNSGAGLRVSFVLGAGSSYTSGTAATAWEALVDANRYVGQTVNLADATSNYWQITGVQLEVGSEATPFENRSYGDELARCQRYYYMLASGNTLTIPTGSYYSSTVVATTVSFPVTMRSNPTLDSPTGTDYYGIYVNSTFDTFNNFSAMVRVNVNGVSLDASGTGASGTAGHSGPMRTNNASAYVAFDAEL